MAIADTTATIANARTTRDADMRQTVPGRLMAVAVSCRAGADGGTMLQVLAAPPTGGGARSRTSCAAITGWRSQMLRRGARLIVYVGSVSLFWFIAAPSANAYIDPGSSSFIVQMLIGAAAGAGLAIATFWRRIVGFFRRDKAKGQGPGEA